MSHPTPWEFHPVHHPSYIDFFEQVLAETTDPMRSRQKYEKQFAEDEWYRHLYRTSYAYHGVHPFYMWYWGAHALQHLGQVIIVGGDARAVRRLGFKPASTLQDALRWRPTSSGRDADDHPPAQPADPHGRRHADRPMALDEQPLVAQTGANCRSRCRAPDRARDGRRARSPTSAPATGADYDTDVGPPLPGPCRPRCCIVEGVVRPAMDAAGRPDRRGPRPPRRPRRPGRSSRPTTTATSTPRCC